MDRETLVASWSEAWDSGYWYAAWSTVLDGLTPEQAAWTPAPERHSIWQIVNHLTFWREYTVRSLAGDAPGDDEANRRTWAAPSAVTAAAWTRAKQEFRDTHQQILRALRDPGSDLEQLKIFLPHDSYHVGQIMYVRALQGLPPLS